MTARGVEVLDDDAAEAWREGQRQTYSSGDTVFLARQQQPVAEVLVEAAGVRAGERVLDVGAGTGNVAVLAAGRGAVVSAVDITPRQVEIGRERCATEGLDVDWHVADAESMPFADGSFDVVLSTFGVVYAARPERAAAEMARVLADGGRILFTAYPRGSFNRRIGDLMEHYLPEAGDAPAVDEYGWADPDKLAGWFPGRDVAITEEMIRGVPQPSLDAWWEALRGTPVLERLRESLPAEEFDAFRRAALDLRAEHIDVDNDGTIHPRNAYVVVRVTG